MRIKGENLILCLACLVVSTDIAGIAIPSWYRKAQHDHNVNTTDAPADSGCVISINVREGLWQRYCSEIGGADCVPNVQEWCDNLGSPAFIEFVVATEICGGIFLLFAIGTIVRSKCRGIKFKMEMVGAEIGLGGVLLIIGVVVYAAADSGEIGYIATDLHAGWGLCLAAGFFAIILFVCCICLDIKSSYLPSGYFPISDDVKDQSDEELLEI